MVQFFFARFWDGEWQMLNETVLCFERERKALICDLKLLDDLAYVIECVALNYTGEAKSSISMLCQKFEAAEKLSSGSGDYHDVLSQLRAADAHLRRDVADIYGAAGVLSRISRSLWERLLGSS